MHFEQRICLRAEKLFMICTRIHEVFSEYLYDVFFKGVDSVIGYLPYGASWYSIRPSDYGIRTDPGKNNFSAPTTDLIPVFVRGLLLITTSCFY